MTFDKVKYKVWTWKNPLMLHWIINPGLAFNELVLGQRVPKITLIEKNNKPLAERSFVPCPHCGTFHSVLKWAPQNHTAFKNWFGLYCDNCGKIIPCLTNLTSYIFLGITFPIRVWFKDKWKARWLEVQKEKFSKPLVLTQPDFKWWYVGLRWGFIMLVIMNILKFKDFTWKGFLIDIPIWISGGLLLGLIIRSFAGRKTNDGNKENTEGNITIAANGADMAQHQ
jgi:hypothetical protein